MRSNDVLKVNIVDNQKIQESSRDFNEWLEINSEEGRRAEDEKNKQALKKLLDNQDAWKQLSTDDEKYKWAYDIFYNKSTSISLPALAYLTNSLDPKVAEGALRLFAVLEARKHNYNSALHLFEEGVAKLDGVDNNYSGLTDLEKGRVLGNYCMRGSCAEMCGKINEQLQWRKETIRLAKEFKMDSPQYHANYAFGLYIAGKHKDAIIEFEKTIKMSEIKGKPVPYGVKKSLKNIKKGLPAGISSSL